MIAIFDTPGFNYQWRHCPECIPKEYFVDTVIYVVQNCDSIGNCSHFYDTVWEQTASIMEGYGEEEAARSNTSDQAYETWFCDLVADVADKIILTAHEIFPYTKAALESLKNNYAEGFYVNVTSVEPDGIYSEVSTY